MAPAPEPDPLPPRRLDRGDGFVARTPIPADVPAMLEVIRAAFPKWPPVYTDCSALEHLEWKMGGPAGGLQCHGVIEHDGRIVAAKLRWLGLAWCDGRQERSDTGADAAVHPDFQGRGLARLFADFEELPNRPGGAISYERPSRHAAVRHMQFERRRFDLRTWVRPLSGRARLGALRRPAVARTLLQLARPRRGNTHTLREIDRFDGHVDALWLAGRHRFDLAQARTADQLNWRYLDPRGGRSRVVGAFEDDRLDAYAVYRPGDHQLRLLDLFAHPDQPGAALAVLRAGVALGRRQGAANLVAWVVPGHPDEPLYAAAGFVAADRFPVEYKVPRGIDAPEVRARLYDPALRRDITMGGFDSF